jgi:ABC-type sugar transport system substrate-binding protein
MLPYNLFHYNLFGMVRIRPAARSSGNGLGCGGAWALRRTAALAYVFAAITFIGCERPPRPRSAFDPDSGPIRIAMIASDDVGPVWPVIVHGARVAAEAFPVRIIDVGPQMLDEPGGLENAVDECINRSIEAAVLFVSGPERLAAAERLAHSGVTLVTVGSDLELPSVAAHIDVHWTGAAQLLAESLDQLLGDRRTYVLVHDREASADGRRRYERFSRVVKTHGGITQLAEVDLKGTRRAAPDRIRPVLEQFRHTALVVSLTPAPWLAESPDRILGPQARFATIGTAPILWRWLREGRAVALAGPLHAQIGRTAVRCAVQAVTGDQVKREDQIIVTELVTPETLGDFARRYAAAAGVDPTSLAPWLAESPSGP